MVSKGIIEKRKVNNRYYIKGRKIYLRIFQIMNWKLFIFQSFFFLQYPLSLGKYLKDSLYRYIKYVKYRYRQCRGIIPI